MKKESGIKTEETETKIQTWKNFFPYEPRLNQEEIAEFLSRNFDHEKISIVEAPYGIGKSISMLSAALATGKKVIFATCNNAAHHAIVDEVLAINKKFNKTLTVCSVIGKEKLCLQESFDYEQCEHMQSEGECEFHNNTYAKKDQKKLSHGANLLLNEIEHTMKMNPHLLLHTSLPKFIKEKCYEKKLCPYEITIELAKRSNVLILDYFHVFTHLYSTTLKRMDINPRDTILLVDEADELKDRILSILTRQTSSASIQRLREQAKKLKALDDEQSVFLDDFHKTFIKFFENKKDGYFDIPKDGFIQFMELNLGLSFPEIQEKMDKIISSISEQSERMSRPDIFLDALNVLDEKQFFYGLKQNQKESLSISNYELTDSVLFAKEMPYKIRDIFDDFSSTVLFSATIGDIEIFKRNLGIEGQFFSSDKFNTDNLKVILKRDISSIYTQRKETAKKVANDIGFLKSLTGNVLLAFPSYAATYDVLPLLDNPNDIDMVKECDKGIYYVVLGGKGSRGINKAHNLSIVYIYGLQIPQKDDYFFNKRKEYLMKKYSQEEAYKMLYANVVNKACQVAGRIFRTKDKKGLVIFADSRYKWDFMQKDFFYKSFPKYFKVKMIETLNEHEFKMIAGNFWGKLF